MPRWFILWSGVCAGAVVSAFCVWQEDRVKRKEEKERYISEKQAKDAEIEILKRSVDIRMGEERRKRIESIQPICRASRAAWHAV